MNGKERDKQLAESLREAFIEKYSDTIVFKELLDEMEDNCLDRMIHNLKQEKSIDLFKDYVVLKEIAADVKMHQSKAVFEEVCKVDDARAWINDNGKYITLAFTALCEVYKKDERLKPLIK